MSCSSIEGIREPVLEGVQNKTDTVYDSWIICQILDTDPKSYNDDLLCPINLLVNHETQSEEVVKGSASVDWTGNM